VQIVTDEKYMVYSKFLGNSNEKADKLFDCRIGIVLDRKWF